MQPREIESTFSEIDRPTACIGETSSSERTSSDPWATPERSRFSTVSKILRGVGALVILAAAAAFLLQSWARGDDLLRYGALSVLTMVLAGAGLACGAWGESKGARTLFLVMLSMLPVHAAVLGGLVYSQISWDGSVTTSLPEFGVWVAPSAGAAIAIAAAALVGLAGLVHLASRALVPKQAHRATVALVVLHAVLLIPVRDSIWVPILFALSVAAALALELRWVPRESGLQTFEGRLVRLLTFVPSALLFVRPHLHDFPVEALNGVALLVTGVSLFLVAQRSGGKNALMISTALVGIAHGWYTLVGAVLRSPSPAEIVLPLSVLLIGLSRWSMRGGAIYRQVGAGLAALGAAAELWLEPGLGSAGVALAIGIVTLAFGVYVRQRVVALFGVVGAASGLIYQLVLAIEHFSWNRWGSLALIGLATILLAALLERNQREIARWTRRFQTNLGRWEM